MEESPRPKVISVCWLLVHVYHPLGVGCALTVQHLTKELCDSKVVLKHNYSGWREWLELL